MLLVPTLPSLFTFPLKINYVLVRYYIFRFMWLLFHKFWKFITVKLPTLSISQILNKSLLFIIISWMFYVMDQFLLLLFIVICLKKLCWNSSQWPNTCYVTYEYHTYRLVYEIMNEANYYWVIWNLIRNKIRSKFNR